MRLMKHVSGEVLQGRNENVTEFPGERRVNLLKRKGNDEVWVINT
jgi:hypothetical protein